MQGAFVEDLWRAGRNEVHFGHLSICQRYPVTYILSLTILTRDKFKSKVRADFLTHVTIEEEACPQTSPKPAAPSSKPYCDSAHKHS